MQRVPLGCSIQWLVQRVCRPQDAVSSPGTAAPGYFLLRLTEPLAPAPFDSPLRLDTGSSARQTDHGRDQEQHDRNEEDDLGDFDRGSGDTAKAQNACDQGDDQERNDPTQHDTDLRFPISVSVSATM